MNKTEINKLDLFNKYIEENKSIETCAIELRVSKTTLKARIIEYDFKGIKPAINDKYRVLFGWFWKEYIDHPYSKSFEQLRAIKVDYYRKTLVEDLKWDRETRTFSPKTPAEIEAEKQERKEEFILKTQGESCCKVLKNPEKYPNAYKLYVELSERYHLKNSFNLEWIKECDEHKDKMEKEGYYNE